MSAAIRIAGPPLGLYLVVDHGTRLEELVAKAGGRTALRLTATTLLAVLPFEGYLALKADSRLASIGPVSIDPARASTLSEILAGTTAPHLGAAREKSNKQEP